jgi:hypothetical protein
LSKQKSVEPNRDVEQHFRKKVADSPKWGIVRAELIPMLSRTADSFPVVRQRLYVDPQLETTCRSPSVWSRLTTIASKCFVSKCGPADVLRFGTAEGGCPGRRSETDRMCARFIICVKRVLLACMSALADRVWKRLWNQKRSGRPAVVNATLAHTLSLSDAASVQSSDSFNPEFEKNFSSPRDPEQSTDVCCENKPRGTIQCLNNRS